MVALRFVMVLGRERGGKLVAHQIVADKKNKAGKTVWAKFSFIVEKIPSVGYATYYLAENEKPKVSPYIKKATGNSVKTDFYTIKTDPARGGGIVSLVENASGKEYMNTSAGGVGNEFFAIKENAHKVEGPWSIHSTGQYWRSGKYPAKVTVEDGPVFSRLIVEAEPVRRNVKIYNGNDVVERTEEEEVLPRR